MKIKLDQEIFTNALILCNLILNVGGEVRFIGGCVRDILSNKTPADLDLATNLLPDQIETILQKNKIKYFSIGKEFGTISAVVHKQTIEITTLRKDIQTDGRWAIVEYTNNWQQDALRRDFTINALSADIDGNVYDYFNGVYDLRDGIVKFIGNPEERIQEDYLRILRFFRFSAYFANLLDESSLLACVKYARFLKNISGYRTRTEMAKIFAARNGLKILKVMIENNIFQEIIPCSKESLANLDKLYSLGEQCNNPATELMCLAIFYRDGNDKYDTIYPLSRGEKKLFDKLIAVKIDNWNYDHLRAYWQKYKNDFYAIALVNLAETKLAIGDDLQRIFKMDISDLPVTGADLLELGIKPGKNIGKLLNIAEDIWYNHEFKLTKQQIIKELLPYAKTI
jgi:poly(A) polymerase